MKPDSQAAKPVAAAFPLGRAIAFLNIFFAALLLVLSATDVSISGCKADLVFPVFVLVFSLITRKAAARQPACARRRFVRQTALPGMLLGGMHVAAAILLVFPSLFTLSELTGERHIESYRDPDSTKVAGVYLRPGGAYAGGHGTMYVRISFSWFPLLERDIYRGTYYSRGGEENQSEPEAVWLGSDSLRITSNGKVIPVGTLRPVMPYFVREPLRIVKAMTYESRKN